MRTSHSDKKLIVITSGDPSGIGPEIILKALRVFKSNKKIIPLVIGDYNVFLKHSCALKMKIPSDINFVDMNKIQHKDFRFGSLNKVYGRAAMSYLALGTSIAWKMKNASLVTAPINKESINKAGFKFTGHTEFLSHVTKSKNVTMMLVGGDLRVSLVTRHIPLNQVAKSLTKDKIIKTAENTRHALKKFFKIPKPKIGVCALNPHAGDGTVLGREERAIIIPALRKLKIKGPYPADTLFYRARRGEFDAVVCMYHDQALIPLKMTAFEKGVNLTVGLPFIRTSPDHGTAFDISGKGKADPASMIEAIKLAAKLSC